MKKILLLIIIALGTQISRSQELLCRISLNYQTLSTPNQQIFTSMYKDLNDYMNLTHWTNYVFSFNERIECSIMLNITQFNGVDQFTATLQVSSSRPVYDASLTTPIMNIQESSPFTFQYIENQPLEFNESTYNDELAYTLAYYAYVIIGMDFDTYSDKGGTEFFQKAQKIVTNAQTSPNNALWTSMGASRENNRYFLTNFLTSETFNDFRSAMYKYHLLGLDAMTKDALTGRNNITEAIDLIRKVYQKKPNNYIINIFLEAKRSEIMNIYSDAPLQEISRIKQILQFIDPSHTADYDKMGTEK